MSSTLVWSGSMVIARLPLRNDSMRVSCLAAMLAVLLLGTY